MRYVKAEELLRLAIRMQGTREGLSLDDMQAETGLSRRSAERLRDAVGRLFEMEEVDTDERMKRWRVKPGAVNNLVRFTAEELAALGTAVGLARRENLADQTATLDALSEKVQAVATRDSRALELDTQLLLEAEGLALRPGPRPIVQEHVLAALREAVKTCQEVTLHHHVRASGKLSRRLAQPYGFLYGSRHYLIAYCPSSQAEYRGFRLFSLPDIEKVDISDQSFERDEDFSLKEYAERSFGAFQEEPFDVVWKFSPAAAPDAREFLFHPTQTLEEQPDGSLIVRFHAGGALEMSWHLFTWGDEVEVLEPVNFWDRVKV